jgi:hypothetical protein
MKPKPKTAPRARTVSIIQWLAISILFLSTVAFAALYALTKSALHAKVKIAEEPKRDFGVQMTRSDAVPTAAVKEERSEEDPGSDVIDRADKSSDLPYLEALPISDVPDRYAPPSTNEEKELISAYQRWKYLSTYAELKRTYPEINPASLSFRSELIDEIKLKKLAFLRRPLAQHAALRLAVTDVLGPRDCKGTEQDPGRCLSSQY